jgi:hypothetical protein
MAAFTDFFENKLLDFLFRGAALTGVATATAAAGTGPATLYIGLFTVAPTDSTAGTEVSGGNYARVAVTSSTTNWAGTQSAGSTTASSGTGGTTSNNSTITFNTPSANWGTVTSFGIFDASTAGNLLIYGNLGVSKDINNGDLGPVIQAAGLTFTIDN